MASEEAQEYQNPEEADQILKRITGNIIEKNETVTTIEKSKSDENGGAEAGKDSAVSPSSVDSAQKAAMNPPGVSALRQLPKSLGDYSGFGELTNAVVSGTNMVKDKVNKALTIPNIDVLSSKMLAAAQRNNLNVGAVNTTLGIVKSALCGDSNALTFDLTSMINALDYDFDFLRSFNICGRSKFRNPIDTLLKGIDNLNHQTKLITGLPKRLFNNAQKAVKNFITSVNLPTSIEACLKNKAILQNSTDLGPGMPIGKLNKFLTGIAPKICNNDPNGIVPDSKVIQKASVSPFIKGVVAYDKKSMYSYYSAILNKGKLDKSILLEILSECFDIKDNKNTLKLLELIAFTKASLNKKTNNKVSSSIASINKDMHKVENSDELVLDNILNALDSGKETSSINITNIKKDYIDDIYASCDIRAIQVLSNFSDDLSGVKDPTKTFDITMKLLSIADPTFIPKDNTDIISNCHQLGALAERSFFSKSNKQLSNNIVTESDGRKFLEVNDTPLGLIDHVGIMHYVNHTVNEKCEGIEK